MKLKETTVYVPMDGVTKKQISREGILDLMREWEGYFFSHQELIELLGSVWDSGFSYHGGSDELIEELKNDVITSLFNTEEDGK